MAARSAFRDFDIKLLPVEKDYPEIQAETSLEVAKYTAIQAAREINAPAIREDHSLFIHALGFPGPFTNIVEKKISARILLKILKNFKDRTGHFEIATVYAKPSGKTFEHVFKVPITFGASIKGRDKEGWDGIIRLYDEKRALTEYPESERIDTWNKGYKAVAKHIVSSN